MREVKLTQREHEKFLQSMERKLADMDMTLDDLAKAINVSIRSIYNFRKDTSRNPSKFLAGKIATYLEMRPMDWR